MKTELPGVVEKAVLKLRRSRPQHAPYIDAQLKKWEAGDAEEKKRIEKLLVVMATPNRAGQLVAGGFALAALALGSYLYLEMDLQRKVDEGESAVALIERHEEGFCVFGSKRHSCVALTLDVRPKGRAAFQATVTRSLSDRWLSRVQAGSWVEVALDPADPQRVYLNESALERPPPAAQ